MTILIDLLFTNTNKCSWKYHMENVTKIKGFYQMTLGKGQSPIDVKRIPNRIIKMMKNMD
jgi:hypothetical protein